MKNIALLFFLATLLFLLLSIPSLQYLEQFGYDLIVPLIFSAVYLLVVLGGAATAATQSRQFTISCMLAAFVFLGQIFTLLTKNTSIFIIEQISSACFLFYIQYLLMVFLFTGRKVTVNVISASLCGYLLLAVLWANLFSLAELFEPGSFVFAYQNESDSFPQSIKMDSSNSIMAIYYSLVTLTTLGYGDIRPTHPRFSHVGRPRSRGRPDLSDRAHRSTGRTSHRRCQQPDRSRRFPKTLAGLEPCKLG